MGIQVSFRFLRCVSFQLGVLVLGSHLANVHGAPRPFTVADEIGLADFGDISYVGKVAAVTWSPNRELVAIHVGRGFLKSDKSQSELRIYAAKDLLSYADGNSALALRPVWTIAVDLAGGGPVIQDIRWARDSTGISFLRKGGDGRMQLDYASLASRRVAQLSRPSLDVTAYDVIDQHHYAFASRDVSAPTGKTGKAPAEVLTGRTMGSIFFPVENATLMERSALWVADGAEPRHLKNSRTGVGYALFDEGLRMLSMSPDGSHIVTAIPLGDVPTAWATTYLPPSPLSPLKVTPGLQPINGESGLRFTSEFVAINSKDGAARILVEAPTGRSAGWYPFAKPIWSPNGSTVALPGIYLRSLNEPSSPPCIGTYDFTRGSASCVEPMTSPLSEPGRSSLPASNITELGFDKAGNIVVSYNINWVSKGLRIYSPLRDGEWKLEAVHEGSDDLRMTLKVREAFDQPPQLVVSSSSGRERVVWDPNPQLSQIALGEVSVLHWQDSNGRAWTGGLFFPVDYHRGTRYPLVIQAHNFEPRVFRPSGLYPTAYAARALAARGVFVLQARCPAISGSTDEGPCQVAGFQAAVELLVEQGKIDPDRVGIVGFSRACYYVVQAVIARNVHFAAASITDGVNFGYWQYLAAVDLDQNELARESAIQNGAFSEWLKRAPTFQFDRVVAPVQIVGSGLYSLMFMWEPYALLRYQHKPVELMLLNTGDHVLTEPRIRLASQGGTVDWMRFWLQGYEDPAPDKAEQYRRWEGLCDLQIAGRTGHPTFCVSSEGRTVH